jgi:hypothetical protein
LDDHLILEELIGLLESNGIRTRVEDLNESNGGLCTINGEKILFLNTHYQSDELAICCADAVLKVVDIEAVYIKPEIRAFIEKQINIH